jgi:calcineurin-like phosphoesterase family protein
VSVTYYTADPHLGHRFVAKTRGFGEDVSAHDAAIVDHWAATVRKDDIVYVLGDVAVSSPTYALGVLAALPGRKRLITGNHDRAGAQFRDAPRWDVIYRQAFEWIAPFGRRRIAGRQVLMSHWPYYLDREVPPRDEQYRLRDHGAMLLHGHLHSNEVRTSPTEIHVGWDAWRRLVPEAEIQDLVTKGDQ